MSDIKLTEEQEKQIWDNAPEWAEYVKIKSIQGFIIYYPDCGCDEYGKNLVAKTDKYKNLPDEVVFQRPDKYKKKSGKLKLKYEDEIWSGVTDDSITCAVIPLVNGKPDFDYINYYDCDPKNVPLTISDILSVRPENNTADSVEDLMNQLNDADNTFKPNYYLDCGEEYSPNTVANVWRLKGSLPQAIKYIKRAGMKPYDGKTAVECEIIDLKKAIQQIQDRVDFLKNKNK